MITYSGHDERSNLPRPPAVPVGELLDVIDRTVRVPDGLARHAAVVTHPLQPFDPRNYEPGRLVGGSPWSFDRLHLDGARAALGRAGELPPFLAHPLDERAPDPAQPVALDALERFVRHPVRAFLRQRLGVSLWDRTRESEDAIPIDLDGLAKWELGERILTARLAGAPWTDCEAAEVARGGLPPGALAGPLLDELHDDIEAILQALAGASGDGRAPTGAVPPAPVDVAVALEGLSAVSGSVAGLRGDVLEVVTYRRIQPGLRLAAWVRLLALTAADPARPFEAVTVCRSENGSRRPVTVARLGPLGPDGPTRHSVATAHLGALVGLFRRGLREPLPLYCKTSAAYASALRAGADDALTLAAKEWESPFGPRSHEDRDPEHMLVFSGAPTFAEMLHRTGAPSSEEEAGLGGGERWRFGLYARCLWDGLLDVERVTKQ